MHLLEEILKHFKKYSEKLNKNNYVFNYTGGVGFVFTDFHVIWVLKHHEIGPK